jgi:hypothetical protein
MGGEPGPWIHGSTGPQAHKMPAIDIQIYGRD